MPALAQRYPWSAYSRWALIIPLLAKPDQTRSWLFDGLRGEAQPAKV